MVTIQLKNKSVSTPHHQNIANYASTTKSTFSLAMTLTFNLWSSTLKTFFAMPNHVANICAKFHWNPSTTYGDIVSREIGVDGQWTDGRLDGQPKNIMPSVPIAGGRDTSTSFRQIHTDNHWYDLAFQSSAILQSPVVIVKSVVYICQWPIYAHKVPRSLRKD